MSTQAEESILLKTASYTASSSWQKIVHPISTKPKFFLSFEDQSVLSDNFTRLGRSLHMDWPCRAACVPSVSLNAGLCVEAERQFKCRWRRISALVVSHFVWLSNSIGCEIYLFVLGESATEPDEKRKACLVSNPGTLTGSQWTCLTHIDTHIFLSVHTNQKHSSHEWYWRHRSWWWNVFVLLWNVTMWLWWRTETLNKLMKGNRTQDQLHLWRHECDIAVILRLMSSELIGNRETVVPAAMYPSLFFGKDPKRSCHIGEETESRIPPEAAARIFLVFWHKEP